MDAHAVCYLPTMYPQGKGKEMKKKPPFGVGDYVVVTPELNTPMYLVVGVDGLLLGVVDALAVLTVGRQRPQWLDRSLFEKPNVFQREKFDKDHAAVLIKMQERKMQNERTI